MTSEEFDRVTNTFPGELPAMLPGERMALITHFGRFDGLIGFQIPGGELRWYALDQIEHLNGGSFVVVGEPKEICE